MRTHLALASLVLATSAHAIPSEHFQLRSAGDLARICATQASEPDAVAAVAFCHGVLAGAYGYYAASTLPAARYVCPPTPAPTRKQIAEGFATWLKARPQFANDGAIDALFRYAAEVMPCKR